MSKIIDISPLISSKLAVWPGDKSFSHDFSMRIDKGAHMELSSITGTVHLGAHCDAPSHYHKGGVGIAARSLEYYYGHCQVMTVSKPMGERVYPADLPNLK